MTTLRLAAAAASLALLAACGGGVHSAPPLVSTVSTSGGCASPYIVAPRGIPSRCGVQQQSPSGL